MKKCFLVLPLLLLMLAQESTLAQIPNPSFEDWVPANQFAPATPVGWIPAYYTTSLFTLGSTISQSAAARTGASAARGDVTFVDLGFAQATYPAYMQATFSYDQRPGELTGYIKFNSVEADSLEIWTTLYQNNLSIPVAFGGWGTATSIGTYTKFTTGPLEYVSAETPDTAWIWIIVSPNENDTTVHTGTWFEIDDLAFEGSATAIGESPAKPATYALHQNYPNPFNPSTAIKFELPQASHVRLTVYNLLGEELAVLVNEQRQAGVYEHRFEAFGLPSGTYFYRIQAGNFSQVRKMTILK